MHSIPEGNFKKGSISFSTKEECLAISWSLWRQSHGEHYATISRYSSHSQSKLPLNTFSYSGLLAYKDTRQPAYVITMIACLSCLKFNYTSVSSLGTLGKWRPQECISAVPCMTVTYITLATTHLGTYIASPACLWYAISQACQQHARDS